MSQRVIEMIGQDYDSMSDSDTEEPSSFILSRPRYVRLSRRPTPAASSSNVPSSPASLPTSIDAEPQHAALTETSTASSNIGRQDLPSSPTEVTMTPSGRTPSPRPEPVTHSSQHPRLQTITFGTLKRASTTNHTPPTSAVSSGKKSKLTVLPSYFLCTNFKHQFQPEEDLSMETEYPKRRRSHINYGWRQRRHHRRSSRNDSSTSGDGDSSSGESANSSYENDKGKSTPKLDSQPLRYQLPSRWSRVDKTEKTELTEDDLQVLYTGEGQGDQDASAIRANRPIPPQCGIYYFEVFIKSKGDQGYIGVGVCNSQVPLDRLPGWEAHSWGYHGDDGNSFGGCGSGRPFGPVFTTGDTIGCGVNFRNMSLFYTKNGVYLGVAFRDLSGPLYPTVGMRTQGEIVEANFGQRKFIFSIDDYVKEEKKQAWQTLEGALHKAEAENQSLPSQTMNQLVLSYMIHHGYAESAKQFSSDMALQSTNLQGLSGKRPISSAMESSSYPPAVVGAERRKAIKEAILTGEIDRAMELLESDHPGIMGSNEDMTLQLHCRKFVEMVNSASASLQLLDHSRERGKDDLKTGSSKDIELVLSDSGRMDIDQDESSGLEDLGTIKNAIEYGQFLQKHYEDNTRHSVQEMLHETFAVLATHHVPGHHHKVASISREKVAETVNTAILAYQNRPTTAPLETLCQQTNVAVSELTRLGVGEAAFFDCSE